jgi:hypothetical protein
MQKYIYVIKLVENKRFIHLSEEKPESQIFKECEIYSDFVRKYKPIHLEEILPLINLIDIDTHVKWYMFLYGIANVKGGSYMEDPLPDYLEKTVNDEFELIEKENVKSADSFLEILEKYEYREYESLEKIDSEISKIKEEFKKYNLEKEKLEKTKLFNKNENNPLWLYELCCIKTFQHESNILETNLSKKIERNMKSENVKTYQKMLQSMKHIFHIFEEYDLFTKYSLEKTVELKYPQFVFDTFIYHSPLNHKLDEVKELCKTLQFMWDIVYNMVKDFEYDV